MNKRTANKLIMILVSSLLVTIGWVQQTSAGVCPAGYQPKNMKCVACTKGSFSANGNKCRLAPAGYFVDSQKAKRPTPCIVGTYNSRPGRKNRSACIKAKPGYYVALRGSSTQSACEIGTYNNKLGQSQCIPASVGYYVTTTAATSQTACPKGTESLVEGASKCSLVAGVEPQQQCISATNSKAGKQPWLVCWIP